jgi:hypothetical protein
MESTKQRMEEIKQQQWKRFQEDSQATTESSPIHAKSQYIIVLGGVAAGLIIATIVWLTVPIMTTEYINTISPESAEAIQTSELKKTNDNIAHLNERMESLTDTVSRLEADLMRVMVLTDTITNTENKHASSSQQDIPESEDAKPTFDLTDPNASRVAHITPEIEKSFVPTHTVKDRINLRPSSSLNSKPIAVLKVGSEVEYISEADGWYYVNTQFHGKGWCSSGYLSPLSPIQ